MNNHILFDTHAHLDDSMFDGDRTQIIESLNGNGVGLLLNAASGIAESYKSLEMAEKYPFIYASVGVHPENADSMKDDDLFTVEQLTNNKKCVAIGEIGLDYHYGDSNKEVQKKWFSSQCKLAKELDLPVIVHDREAHGDCFEIVKKYGVKGVFHCYSGSKEMAEELVKLGFYISFTGVITFRNAKKSYDIIKALPEDRIMIETDCPYLSPEPFRGTRNEPKNVLYTAMKIAEIRAVPLERIIDITACNGKTLYHI